MSSYTKYHITWPVPVTKGDAKVWCMAGVPIPSVLIDTAVRQVRRLSTQCPAGGVLPEPGPGESWGLRALDDTIYTGDEETLPTDPGGEVIYFTLVLLDAHGAPYEPEELVQTRPQAAAA